MKIRSIARSALLVSATLLLSGCSSTGGAITDMNASEFSAKTQEAGVVVLDVRTRDEFNQGHITGAINIDVETDTFENEVSKLDKNATYAVYCRSGRRSLLAVDAMAGFGFTTMFNLKNGIIEWQAQGLPVVNS